SVHQIGQPLPSLASTDAAASDLDAAERLAGGGSGQPLTATADVSGEIRPLRVNPLNVAWPGSSPALGAVLGFDPPTISTALASRPEYSRRSGPPGSAGPGYAVLPRGTVTSGGQQPGSEPHLDLEQSYRALRQVAMPLVAQFRPLNASDVPFILAPIGEY